MEKKYSSEEISRISGETKNEDLISMGFEDADVPDIPAGNFEEARNIFIHGQKFYNEAKEYYTFEEHCVDYTEINQVLPFCLLVYLLLINKWVKNKSKFPSPDVTLFSKIVTKLLTY